jgi:prepilin-type N-terminal cleavage/methylation domain-containing protein
MSRLKSRKEEKGFTLIELLIVAAFIGILLALTIPNLLKARISANEANARKMMQTLRDAESEYFEQDLNNSGGRDYTNLIGKLATGGTLRCPSSDSNANTGNCVEEDALIDSTFEGAVASGATANCPAPKAGYCVQSAGDVNGSDPLVLQGAFGWEASMTKVNMTGRRDFSVYEDNVIRCVFSQESTGDPGRFQSDRTSPACDSL